MRIRRPLLAVVPLVAALAACAPTQSGPAGAGGDEKTGTLRVWLFDEATRAPKEATVAEAVTEFKASHPGVEVDVQWIPVEDGRTGSPAPSTTRTTHPTWPSSATPTSRRTRRPARSPTSPAT